MGARAPRVVRVSPSPRTTSAQRMELRRILGVGGNLVHLSPLEKTPQQLLDEIRRQAPHAVVLDGPNPEQGQAVRAAGEFVVLQRITDAVKGPHGLEERWVGYGRLNERGELERLADGALAPTTLQADHGVDL